MDYCLINPDSRTFCPVDRHGEIVIRDNKGKARPSANAKSDELLRKTVARNVPTLRACKAAMYKSAGTTDYRYRHSPVDAIHDVAPIANTLPEARVFERSRDGVAVQQRWWIYLHRVHRLRPRPLGRAAPSRHSEAP